MHPARGQRRLRGAMEDVLDVYTRPYDPRRPQLCLDETSRQLLGEVAPPPPPHRRAPASPRGRTTSTCGRGLQPLPGLRAAARPAARHVTARRTRVDFAHCIKDLVDVHYPEAERSCWSWTT